MAKKQKLKRNEARILIYLANQKNDMEKFAKAISRHLNTDYGYLLRTLECMVAKGWIKKHVNSYGKSFYFLTGRADLALAAEVLTDMKKEGKEKQMVFVL